MIDHFCESSADTSDQGDTVVRFVHSFAYNMKEVSNTITMEQVLILFVKKVLICIIHIRKYFRITVTEMMTSTRKFICPPWELKELRTFLINTPPPRLHIFSSSSLRFIRMIEHYEHVIHVTEVSITEYVCSECVCVLKSAVAASAI